MAQDPVHAHDEYVANIIEAKIVRGKAGTVYIPELFATIGNLTVRPDKIKALRANQTPALLTMLRLCYTEGIEWDFTRRDLDALDYKPMDIPDYDTAPTSLFREGRKMPMFTNEKVGNRMSPEKALKVINEWFSGMHPNDVELVKQMVNGNFKAKGLTEKLVKEAFPDLLPKETQLPFDPPPETGDDNKTESESDSENKGHTDADKTEGA
jgi:hypothetical protein